MVQTGLCGQVFWEDTQLLHWFCEPKSLPRHESFQCLTSFLKLKESDWFLDKQHSKSKSSVLFTKLFCACMYRMYESIIYKGLKRGSITCSASKRGDSTGIFMASVSKSGEFPFIHACKL